MSVQVKRIYESESPHDGHRVLVDRLWPRGLSKERADPFEWDKDLAPSTELRTWYQHDPAKYAEFVERYRAELTDPAAARAFAALKKLVADGPVTLLTASKAVEISDAQVLASLLADDNPPKAG